MLNSNISWSRTNQLSQAHSAASARFFLRVANLKDIESKNYHSVQASSIKLGTFQKNFSLQSFYMFLPQNLNYKHHHLLNNQLLQRNRWTAFCGTYSIIFLEYQIVFQTEANKKQKNYWIPN